MYLLGRSSVPSLQCGIPSAFSSPSMHQPSSHLHLEGSKIKFDSSREVFEKVQFLHELNSSPSKVQTLSLFWHLTCFLPNQDLHSVKNKHFLK